MKSASTHPLLIVLPKPVSDTLAPTCLTPFVVLRAPFFSLAYTRAKQVTSGLATHKFSMFKDFKTMPAYFKEAGYYTGFLGKTHINPERLVEDHIDYRALKGAKL